MVQIVSSSTRIFSRRQRRRRVRNLIAALTVLTGLNGVMIASRATAGDGSLSAFIQDDAFSRLVAPTGLVPKTNRDETDVYAVVGSSLQFVFRREAREASIRFLCTAGSADCPDDARKSHKLISSQAGRGDISYRSEDGELVLRIVSTGGSILFGGASFVPPSVSPAGAPVSVITR
ncbi:hypothetical protein [Parvularcula sp. LCG005]|uniref:hypothetical protein n=1 Tax=Parvularcula sp. LCG005 TaxID=3078805 RepID=UPI002942E02D|nr:hypothetical protein [Parvularcula sp. LCG005]WOI53899.1 hypothetical protein RUI03_02590 [Parvularcula sp. LCG005]